MLHFVAESWKTSFTWFVKFSFKKDYFTIIFPFSLKKKYERKKRARYFREKELSISISNTVVSQQVWHDEGPSLLKAVGLNLAALHRQLLCPQMSIRIVKQRAREQTILMCEVKEIWAVSCDDVMKISKFTLHV